MKIKMLIILLIMGLCLYYDIALIFSFEKIYPDQMDISCICEIIEGKEEKQFYNKYVVKILENEDLPKSKNTKLIIYLKKEYIVGDILKIKGNFEKGEVARNYKGFNYRRYLKQNGIYGIVIADDVEYINYKKDAYFLLDNVRNIIEKQIDKLYENENANFLKGLLIGNKSKLDKEIIEDFKDSNISHILAISGLHISFIVIGIKFILDMLINSKKVKDFIIIFFLISFLFLTGNSVSCMRACIMNVFAILSSLFYRKNNFYINFSCSLIFILILNPYNIFSVGMWLSYCGTIGIVILYDFIYKFLHKKIKFNSKLLIVISKSLVLSISAQILIVPIMIYVFNSFSLNFFIANIVVSFFIGYILAIGYISIFISFIFLPFSQVLSFLENIMIYIIFQTAKISSNLPLSQITLVTPNFIFILLCYSIFFFIVIYFKNNKFKMLRKVLNLKFKEVIKKFFVIFLIISIVFKIDIIDFKLKIYFVDVGQGDCTFIITPYGKTIIVDGGEGNSDKYDYGENVVYPYLLDRKIKRIDYLFVSHADSDHIGGLIYILKNMKVEKILIGMQAESSKQLEDLIKIANKNNIKIILLKSGDEINIDKTVNIQVLWPQRDKFVLENTLNNNSLVFKLKYNNFSMLFTGDIEEIAEKEITDLYKNNLSILKSTIIKIAHHGSKSSSTQQFLNAVSPQIGLIGVGKKNKYGHPNDDVLLRLKNMRN